MLNDPFAFTYKATEIEPLPRYCVNDITFLVIGPDIGYTQLCQIRGKVDS